MKLINQWLSKPTNATLALDAISLDFCLLAIALNFININRIVCVTIFVTLVAMMLYVKHISMKCYKKRCRETVARELKQANNQ